MDKIVPNVLVGGEVVEPTIVFETVAQIKVRGLDIQNRFITHEHLDEELASVQKT